MVWRAKAPWESRAVVASRVGRLPMLSPKRCAQMGLGAAGLVLVSSVAVLLVGAAEVPGGAASAARSAKAD